MQSLVRQDNKTKHFVVDTEAEIECLPLLDRAGKENLITVKNATMGSTAKVIENSKVYMLNGKNNQWIPVTAGGGGGGGSDPEWEYADDDDIRNIFNDMF